MSNDINKQKLDDVLTFLIIKRLITPISKSRAYQLGLVNNLGRVVKTPETEEEKKALTLLDRLIFKLKRLIGGKLTQLNNFLFVQTLGNDFYNTLVVKGSIDQRAEIKRLRTDIKNIEEKYNIDNMLHLLIHEYISEVTNEEGKLKDAI